MVKDINDPQTLSIPEYNLESLVKAVTRVINQSRRGVLSPSDALDEIVRVYQEHSSI